MKHFRFFNACIDGVLLGIGARLRLMLMDFSWPFSMVLYPVGRCLCVADVGPINVVSNLIYMD